MHEQQTYCWTSESQCLADVQEVMSTTQPGERQLDLSGIPLRVWPRNSRPLIKYNEIHIPGSLLAPQPEAFPLVSCKVGRGQGILHHSDSTVGPGPDLTLYIEQVVGKMHRLHELEKEYGRTADNTTRATQQPPSNPKAVAEGKKTESVAFDKDFPPL